MAREKIISQEELGPEDEKFNSALRPESLEACIGMHDLLEKLSISITAARQRKEPMEHVLLHGPPGLGKTTLAYVIANEMGSTIRVSSGPALTRPGDLIGILTNLEAHDVLFIDEIHRLSPAVEEYIYPAMEDYKVDFIVDSGMHSRTINLPLKPFTLLGATTRSGMLSPPLRTRFGITHHLEFWTPEDLFKRCQMSADMLDLKYEEPALAMLADRARGTPRIANRLLRRCRDFAQVKGDGHLTIDSVEAALDLEGIDHLGLDELDRSFLRRIIEIYNGGPVGIEAVAATLGEETDTLVDVVEPFLLQNGLLARTRRGRMVTAKAYGHLGVSGAPPQEDAGLFAQQ
ncbi:MAG: Holliday junction branch migration DNA helicase RuvB [Phycisphaerales bacterium]|jgi:holliday junction DNA helicase RuvB|nr:Holliday junction branch migration DNA helicase RuvB [Phycisphaerales bacterium]